MRGWRGAAIAYFATTALSGCIVYPKKVTEYDHDCAVTSHHLTLEAEYIWGDCNANSTAEAEACLIIIGGSALASTLVSGSIVIVGNTIYWLEKQGRCERPRYS